MESLSTQLYAFLIVILAGLSVGLLFDAYRVLRGILRPGMVSTAVMDILFWALITPVVIVYLLLANWGELRGYVVIGLLLGFMLYRLVMSRTIIAILLWVVNLVSKLINLLVTIVLSIASVPFLFGQEIGLVLRRRGYGKLRLAKLKITKPKLRWNSRLNFHWRR